MKKSRSRKRIYKRTTINIPMDLIEELEDLSALTHESLSSIIIDKVRQSLELDEDAYWAKIVKERMAFENEPTISHEEMWKHLK